MEVVADIRRLIRRVTTITTLPMIARIRNVNMEIYAMLMELPFTEPVQIATNAIPLPSTNGGATPWKI